MKIWNKRYKNQNQILPVGYEIPGLILLYPTRTLWLVYDIHIQSLTLSLMMKDALGRYFFDTNIIWASINATYNVPVYKHTK